MQRALVENFRLFLVLFFISIFLFFTDYLRLLEFPKSLVQVITSPIQYGFYRTGVSFGRQFEFVFLARRAAQENNALKDQLSQVISENANLRRKLAETEGFLAQQNTLSQDTFKLTPARVIGFYNNRFLLLDKGSTDGLKQAQSVVFKDNYLGKIIEVAPRQSKVILASDPDSKIGAFVTNKDGVAKGLLQGQFGSEILLDKVSHQDPLNVGDLVYSDGTEGDLPRGLVLGTVSQVLNRENEVFKQAKIKSVFEVANLDVVFVITN